MLRKIKRTLMFLDDLAEVLVVHVLFSRKNRRYTIPALLLAAFGLYAFSHKVPKQSLKQLSDLGYRELQSGQFSRAVHHLRAAVKKAPKDALLLQRLGLAQLEKGQNQEALRSLHRSLEIDPSRNTLYYLGCAYQNLKLFDVAIGIFRELKSDPPKGLTFKEPSHLYVPIAEAKIGECYTRRGDVDQAIQKLNQTILFYPNHPHAYFYLGVAYWEQKNLDLGVEQFFKVIELYPRESAAYYNIACYFSLKGLKDQALEWLEKSFKVGFNQFKHMETDKDLDPIRNLVEYRKLVSNYKRINPHD